MGGQGLCSVTADGNKNFNNHKSGRKTLTYQSANVLRPELWLLKFLFPSAVTLHRPWPPILISILFYPGLFSFF